MKYIVFICAICSILLVAACSPEQPANVAVNSKSAPAQPAPIPEATVDELASGRKVYQQNCATCHQEDGSGGEMEFEGKKLKPDDLTSAKIKAFSDEKIIGYILKGVPDEGMPAFEGKLSEGEMRDVVKFIRVQLQKNPAS